MHIKSTILGLTCVITFLGCLTDRHAGEAPVIDASSLLQVAERPPMGWNSFDCYGATVTEAEVKANADYMAEHLSDYGWEYVVIDYCWSHPSPGDPSDPNLEERKDGTLTPMLALDKYGRQLPAPERFPSAAGGKGFRPLADYVHGKGLKFGIHIMRGIPRHAVTKNLPVLGTKFRAADVADQEDTCAWLNHMYGVDMKKESGQAYYDSVFQLYAEWKVDYVKADDMLFDLPHGVPGPYHAEEIEGMRRAISKCGRPILLSLSPGPTELDKARHLQRNADLWRISTDIWDDWNQIKDQFDFCQKWAPYTGPGHWADIDMLPLGRISMRGPRGPERYAKLTKDEQFTLMTLWLIYRSPLMFGGDLPSNDAFTLFLLTNEEVLAVNQNSVGNRQLFRRGDQIGWVADVPDSRDKYVALFNLSESGAKVSVSLEELGLKGDCEIRDLWLKNSVGHYEKEFAPVIASHGAGLYRISP